MIILTTDDWSVEVSETLDEHHKSDSKWHLWGFHEFVDAGGKLTVSSSFQDRDDTTPHRQSYVTVNGSQERRAGSEGRRHCRVETGPSTTYGGYVKYKPKDETTTHVERTEQYQQKSGGVQPSSQLRASGWQKDVDYPDAPLGGSDDHAVDDKWDVCPQWRP